MDLEVSEETIERMCAAPVLVMEDEQVEGPQAQGAGDHGHLQARLQEEVNAQLRDRSISASGRVRKAPARYGFEQERAAPVLAAELAASPFVAEERLITPLATPDVSPDASMLVTPASTPGSSSALLTPDSSWLPLEGVQLGRTARERAQDIIERHRHWSHAGEGVPNHPRFDGWKSRLPPGQSPAGESMEGSN